MTPLVFAVEDIVLYDENDIVLFSIVDDTLFGSSMDNIIGRISGCDVYAPDVQGTVKVNDSSAFIEIVSYDEEDKISGKGLFYKGNGKLVTYTDCYGNSINYEYDKGSGKLIHAKVDDVINNMDEIFDYDVNTGKKLSCTYIYEDSEVECPYLQFNEGNYYIDGSHLLKLDMCDYEVISFYEGTADTNYVLWNENYSACIERCAISEDGDAYQVIKKLSDENVHIESTNNTLVYFAGVDDEFYCFKLVNDRIDLDSCFRLKLIENRHIDVSYIIG